MTGLREDTRRPEAEQSPVHDVGKNAQVLDPLHESQVDGDVNEVRHGLVVHLKRGDIPSSDTFPGCRGSPQIDPRQSPDYPQTAPNIAQNIPRLPQTIPKLSLDYPHTAPNIA